MILSISPARIVLGVGLALLPVYLFDSGMVQISHLLLAGFVAISIVQRGIYVDRVVLVLFALVFVALTRDALSVMWGDPDEWSKMGIYLAFNALVVMCLRRDLQRKSYIEVAKMGSIAGVFVAAAGVIAIGEQGINQDGVRAIGTFNNPNQLGYYAVCAASTFSVLALAGMIRPLTTVVMIGLCGWLAIASLSKAAMTAMAIPLIAVGFAAVPRRYRYLAGAVVTIAICSAGWVLVSEGHPIGSSAVGRLATIGQQEDDSLERRGYLVLTNAKSGEVIFGMGESKVVRLLGHEVHGTLAGFLANYGIVGLLLIFWVLGAWAYRVFRRFGWLGVLLCVVPAMLYGLAHNGARFTPFWCLVAVSLAFSGVRAVPEGNVFVRSYGIGGRQNLGYHSES